MGVQYICPECQKKLVLHRPAIASTRIKCRECGAKFYAGHSTTTGAPVAAGATSPTPTRANPSPELADKQPVPAADPSVELGEQRQRHREQRPVPKWAAPVAVAGLLAVTAAGVLMRPQPQLPEERPLPPVAPEVSKTDGSKSPNPPLPIGMTMEAVRPNALVGVWELQGPTTGTLDFRADGAATIHAPLLDDKPLQFSSLWYVVLSDGDNFELQLGPLPHRPGNHVARVSLQADGSLKMTRYATSAGLSIQERVFTKRP
jgi:hypothetical protein